MPSIRSMAAAAAGIAVAATYPASPSDQFSASSANGPPYLNDIARNNGKLWFGAAADVPGPEQQNLEYMTILNNTRIFGEITPANYMKWEFTEPERGVYNYTGGNVAADIAADHSKFLRCHNLVWNSENPAWLNNGVAEGKFSNSTMITIMEQHISHLIKYWGGRCYAWDVVNEALNGDGTFASNPFYDVIGPAYFPIAYKAAEKAVKETKADIKLYYNDYGIENPGTKQAAALALLSSLQEQKIQIDGVGFESHFVVGGTPSAAAQVASMESFTAIGLDVTITELDIRLTNVSTQATPAGFALQAQDYWNTVQACMQVDRCVGITVWDFDDQYSWIPSTFPGQGYADLYFSNFTRKPAYCAVAEALEGAKCSVCGDGTA